jgi:hypothetical protein
MKKLVSSDFSKYGLTLGVMKSIPFSVTTYGLVCMDWPAWAVIFIKNSIWFQKITSWFPETEVILHQTGIKLSNAFYKIKLWLRDIDPTRSFCLWSSESSANTGHPQNMAKTLVVQIIGITIFMFGTCDRKFRT